MAGPRVEAVESAPAGHDAGETIRRLRDSLLEKAGPGDGIPPSVPAKLFYLPDRSPPLGLMEDALAAAGVAEATAIEVDAAKVGGLKREYVLFSAPPRRGKILKRAVPDEKAALASLYREVLQALRFSMSLHEGERRILQRPHAMCCCAAACAALPQCPYRCRIGSSFPYSSGFSR